MTLFFLRPFLSLSDSVRHTIQSRYTTSSSIYKLWKSFGTLECEFQAYVMLGDGKNDMGVSMYSAKPLASIVYLLVQYLQLHRRR